MARYALVDADGLVVNVIVWSGDTEKWQPPEDQTPVLDEVGVSPGWTWNGADFLPPAEPEVKPA